MKYFLTQLVSRKNTRGFTLLEALIGISIVVVAITATFGATQNGLQSAVESRDQITAFYLAQEGVEYIRNVRDTNRIHNDDWLKGIAELPSDPCFFGKTCIVDAVLPATNPPVTCSSGLALSCPNIRQDLVAGSTFGFYGNSASWTTTNFNREIRIDQNVSGREVVVVVTMKWGNGSTFVARELLLNWQ